LSKTIECYLGEVTGKDCILGDLDQFCLHRLVKQRVTASATISSLYVYPKNLGCNEKRVQIFIIINPNSLEIVPIPFF
jgi:hypothetical protein